MLISLIVPPNPSNSVRGNNLENSILSCTSNLLLLAKSNMFCMRSVASSKTSGKTNHYLAQPPPFLASKLAAISPKAQAMEKNDSTEINSSVAQPAGLQLVELNKRSASLGGWDIGIYKPEIEEWTYPDKKTGQEKKGAAFRCLVVYLSDPTQYVKGEIGMKGQDMAPLKKAMDKYAENKCFRMSAVAFQQSAQQEYLHTPIKFAVNMSNTKFEPLMHKNDGGAIHPQPSMTLCELNELQQTQRFDVTALVEGVEDPVTCKNNRAKRKIKVIDLPRNLQR